MLDPDLSTEEYRCYKNLCKDGRIRCVLVYNDGTKKTISYPKLLMENYLGRKLLPEEQVHHIDENPLNNDLSNLMVVLRGEHQRQHSTGKHYIISDETRKKRSLIAKELWKKGVYDNVKHPVHSEEHKQRIREGVLRYYRNKKKQEKDLENP